MRWTRDRWQVGWALAGAGFVGGVIWLGQVAPSPAQQDPTQPPTSTTSQPTGGEEKLEASEDVELLDAYIKAKQFQVRQAELRVNLAKVYRDDSKRKVELGYLNSVVLRERELQVSEAETELAFRIAELKDFQVRANRAKRRLARLQIGE
jgi:hypothetical protein